jgi:hypothetical protein
MLPRSALMVDQKDHTMPTQEQSKNIKLAVAVGILAVGGLLLAYQLFFKSDTPTADPAALKATAQEEAITKAAAEQSKSLEVPPELQREQRAPRTVIGR